MNNQPVYRKNQIQTLILLLKVLELKSLEDNFSEIFLFLARYSFLFENTENSLNSCTLEPSQIYTEQAFSDWSMKFTDPDGRTALDYKITEGAAVLVGFATGGVKGAVNGYLKAKRLENYNGPQRDAANSAIIGENITNPKDDPNYMRLPDSEAAFHQLEDGSEVSKYVAVNPDNLNGGKAEIVWNDSKNELVTDPKARGTYNYGTNKLTHTVKDVIPWIILGTGKDDPSNMAERAWDTLKAAPAFFEGLRNKNKGNNNE